MTFEIENIAVGTQANLRGQRDVILNGMSMVIYSKKRISDLTNLFVGKRARGRNWESRQNDKRPEK